MGDLSHHNVEFMEDSEDENEDVDKDVAEDDLPLAKDCQLKNDSFLARNCQVEGGYKSFSPSTDPSSPFIKLSSVGVIVCFFGCLIYFVLATDQVSCKTSFEDIEPQLLLLKKKFPSQHITLWSGIIAGLKNLNKTPAEPAVYLLAFEENAARSSSCIAEAITTLAAKILQPCETRKWLLVNGSHLSESRSQEPGDLIDAISQEKEHSRIVLVPDVHKIPAKLAQGFHSLVDAYGMMSKKPRAVYIFTLTIPRVNLSNITEISENILLNEWRDLDRDELQPLVTRITHSVLPVFKEKGDLVCPMKINSTIELSIP